MATLAPLLKFKEWDSNGNPLSGGKLYSYVAGTSTPASTFSDESGAVPNSNPVILDSEGRADVWLSASTNYKFVLKDADDVTIWTVDDVSGGSSAISTTSWSAWTEHETTDGQSATDLTGETVDGASYSSAIYEVEIIRGTTVVSNGQIALQYVNGTWQVVKGGFISTIADGVTFSVSQTTTVAQLRAALDSGAGDGTIKLSKRLIPA
jgi:hypothetical protein